MTGRIISRFDVYVNWTEVYGRKYYTSADVHLLFQEIFEGNVTEVLVFRDVHSFRLYIEFVREFIFVLNIQEMKL